MSNRTEHFDRQRKNMRGGQIIALALVFITWLAYCIIEMSRAGAGQLQKTLLIICYAFLAVLIYFGIRLRRNAFLINQDPVLKEALHNELVRLNRMKAWRAAFFAILAFLTIVGIISIFIPIKNLLLISSAIIVGLGVRNITLYIQDH